MTLSQEAMKYLGKREKSGNSGFEDPIFELEMKEESWQKGWAWCCVFLRVVAVNTFPEKTEELRKLITPSVVQTFKNFRDAAYPIGYLPQPNTVVFYQSYKDGKPQGTGHVGIVTKATGETYEDISGNTNEAGSREGVTVGLKDHRYDPTVVNGLRVIGFINIGA